MSERGVYYVNAITVATAATDAHAIFQVWNPSATRAVELLELSMVVTAAPGAGAGFVVRRSTARGTPGSTVTPTAEQHARRQAAPDSGFLLDLAAFTVQPTLAAGELSPSWVYAAVAASGLLVPVPRGIEIPAGTGLVVVNRAAIIFPASEVGIVVGEL